MMTVSLRHADATAQHRKPLQAAAVHKCRQTPPCRALLSSRCDARHAAERNAVRRMLCCGATADTAHAAHDSSDGSMHPIQGDAEEDNDEQNGASAAVTMAAEAAAAAAMFADCGGCDARGSWQIKPMTARHMPKIIELQSNAFYESAGIALLDSLFHSFFQAEVREAMKAKLRSDPDTFLCLVAVQPPAAVGGSYGGNGDNAAEAADGDEEVLGVVEVSMQDQPDMVAALRYGGDVAAYVASMAVDSRHQRRGIARSLLRGCETLARHWGFKELVLHVHTTNEAAVQLYRSSGYDVILSDPSWKAVIGSKPRLTMVKQL